MKNRTGLLIGGIAVVIATVFYFLQPGGVDDRALKAMLVGTWRAEDVENGALNNRKGGVAQEEVVVKPNGTLKYLVIPKPGQGEAEADEYAWEVAKGKLKLRLIRAGVPEDSLPSLPISVDQARLTLRRKGYSTKVFERITS